MKYKKRLHNITLSNKWNTCILHDLLWTKNMSSYRRSLIPFYTLLFV